MKRRIKAIQVHIIKITPPKDFAQPQVTATPTCKGVAHV